MLGSGAEGTDTVPLNSVVTTTMYGTYPARPSSTIHDRLPDPEFTPFSVFQLNTPLTVGTPTVTVPVPPTHRSPSDPDAALYPWLSVSTKVVGSPLPTNMRKLVNRADPTAMRGVVVAVGVRVMLDVAVWLGDVVPDLDAVPVGVLELVELTDLVVDGVPDLVGVLDFDGGVRDGEDVLVGVPDGELDGVPDLEGV